MCCIITPLGLPVDPDVYITYARSSGLLTGDETKAGTLFDLESDPAEQHDVSSQNSEVVKRLQAMASEMQKQVDEALAKRKQAVK